MIFVKKSNFLKCLLSNSDFYVANFIFLGFIYLTNNFLDDLFLYKHYKFKASIKLS